MISLNFGRFELEELPEIYQCRSVPFSYIGANNGAEISYLKSLSFSGEMGEYRLKAQGDGGRQFAGPRSLQSANELKEALSVFIYVTNVVP